MGNLLIVVFLAVAFGVPIFCFARFVGAIFSPALRQHVIRHWIFHSVLALTSVFLLFLLLTPGVPLMAAKRAKMKNEMEQLRTAILAYKTEYGSAPPTNKNAALIKILTGEKSTDNPRGIAFLYVKPSDMNGEGEMVDPWGKPFQISLADPDKPVISASSQELKNGQWVPIGD